LEGALRRSLKPLRRPEAREVLPPLFDGPAAKRTPPGQASESILDPFSVYRKGEALLRRQLSALSGWHLVNIILRYGLSTEGSAILSAMEPAHLVEIIVDGVRQPAARRS
jgi:hypothetical protein